MSKKQSESVKYFERPTNHFSAKVFAALVLVVLGWFAWVAFFGAVNDGRQQEISALTAPPTRDNMTAAEIALREEQLPLLNDCENDERANKERVEEFDTYLRVNKEENRALIRGCEGIDRVLALNKDGVWFALFTIDADGAQDNEVRRACGIEDITTGSDELGRTNDEASNAAIALCRDIEAAYERSIGQ